MLIMEKDGVEWVERKAIVAEWEKNQKYINFLKELGKALHMEVHMNAKIEEIEGHPVS